MNEWNPWLKSVFLYPLNHRSFRIIKNRAFIYAGDVDLTAEFSDQFNHRQTKSATHFQYIRMAFLLNHSSQIRIEFIQPLVNIPERSIFSHKPLPLSIRKNMDDQVIFHTTRFTKSV